MSDCRDCKNWRKTTPDDRYGFCINMILMENRDTEIGITLYRHWDKCKYFEEKEIEMKNRCGGCESWTWAAGDTGLCGQAEVGRMVVTHLGGTPEIDRHFGCIFYGKRPTFRTDGPCIEHVPTGKKISLPETPQTSKEELCQWLNELYPAEGS